MSRAKKELEPQKPATASVRLLCILSGDGVSWNPGDVIEVPLDDAERLISIGAAEAA